MPDRLSVDDARYDFGAGAGLFGASLTVAPGEIHAVVGLNGSGKTTLMRAVVEMIRLTSGRVRVDGVDVTSLRARDWARVGHVIEQPFAYPEHTVRANLEMAALLHGVGDELTATVDRALGELGIEKFAGVLARRLSLGNRQRLGIAAALQHRPTLIMLDEPTNALDPAGVILVREALLRHAARGAGILVSSHHLDEVARVAHRISVFNRGRVVGALDPSGRDLERTFFRIVHADDESRTS
ncbi:ABC transporter ATP-binding protein [Aeromicrobium phragmitis]|uniref:ABC transporter ATP-binding protein n=1 Tax=Aeromicrobium phragmitis TaxID=2478914 RepID=A0A3L8PLS6_9ACTN|nr:ABC transporter ATP-binding protein [Aeromicrobium phragmitis]RLV56301.1 ABC transporter ATP-binding protein [Aeromicrobium phragmitis]